MEAAGSINTTARGNHRGCMPPDIEKLVTQAKEYRYDQYEESMTNLTELLMMISMGIPAGFIHELSSQRLAVCDLDFVRIVYFILGDEDYIKQHIIPKESYVYEDILEDVIEEAVKKKYPEFSDTKLAYEEYRRLEKMADERIRFIDLQNEKLREEIRSRQEEKQLKESAAFAEIESLKAECADRDETISILSESASDLESEKKSLQRDIAELEEEKKSLSDELKMEREKGTHLEDSLESLKAENREQKDKDRASIKESLEAVTAGINRILIVIDKLDRIRPRRGIRGIFGSGEAESRADGRTRGPNDDLVRSILTDPDIAPDQYRLLIYCEEAGLPVSDIREIADTKVDIERMEFLARWYFRKNNIDYRYEGMAMDKAGKIQERTGDMTAAAKTVKEENV